MASSKRPNAESKRKGKRQKSGGGGSSSLDAAAGGVVFRMLCPATRIGGVIGKGGGIISQIRQETGVNIKIDEPTPGCDERVIIFSGSEKENGEDNVDKEKEKEKEASNDETESKGKGDEEEEAEEKGGDNDDVEDKEVEDSQGEKANSNSVIHSAIRKALSLVFDRMVEGVEDTADGDEESGKASSFVFRLLILSNQVGCLLGKGGSVIKKMSAESGAQIRILPKDKLPVCASASDEIVQITGGVEVVRKALQSVSLQLLENPPRDHESLSTNFTGPSSHSSSKIPSHNRSFAAGPTDTSVFHSAPSLISKFHEGAIHGRMRPSQEMLTFRLLCPAEKVGNLIGKGGAIIKSVQQETASEIKVIDAVPDSEDCVIVISGPAHPDDRISPVQEAVFRVQNRVARAIPDVNEHSMLARVLVSSNQIGCLLGKGGSIITEMRKLSGAHIRILGKDKIPKCASENEEVIQITGEIEAVHDALLQITTRLKHHFFRDAYPSANYPSNPAFLDNLPPFLPYLGRRGISPPGMYSDLGPPPPHAGFPLDDRPPFMNNIHRSGIPPHIAERKPWGPQGILEGGGHMGLPDFAGGPPRRILGFGGGNQPIITHTSATVEVVVPRAVVPEIYGEDGECLRQILQISDAKIMITDPKPGAVETKIIISGTPEQTHAAQSLIQAFVMSERDSG
ncbi:KH domain-containing protein HEN4-like [Lotus japonicus]|uniref:KH domain-containing protein HEN4-like n=1 Tax=Lotus japonicus TaxID=34305 RepID=UPI0025903F96|nr:KH domain-containing protein HEN4-like [Lotus japonicus]